MSRPDYIKCIQHTRADKVNESWCGRNLSTGFGVEFSFTSIDHAAYTVMSGSRLLPCPECLKAIWAVLQGEGTS